MKDARGDPPRAKRKGWCRTIEFKERARGYVDLDIRHREEIIENARGWLRPVVKHEEHHLRLESIFCFRGRVTIRW